MSGTNVECNGVINSRVLALTRMEYLIRRVTVMLGILLLKSKAYLYGLLKVKDAKI